MFFIAFMNSSSRVTCFFLYFWTAKYFYCFLTHKRLLVERPCYVQYWNGQGIADDDLNNCHTFTQYLSTYVMYMYLYSHWVIACKSWYQKQVFLLLFHFVDVDTHTRSLTNWLACSAVYKIWAVFKE